MHFLARCSNFYKPFKKSRKFFRQTRSPRQKWPPCRTRNGELSIVFQSREQAVVRRDQIRRIGLVIKTLEAQVEQFLLVCKGRVSRGIVVQEQDSLGDLPAAFILQNVLQSPQQRWVILRVDSLALWKILNEVDAVLIQKNRERYATTPLIVGLSPGHNDITRFRPWLPIVTGNNLDRAEKDYENRSDDQHRWRFWSAFRHFGTHIAESFRMSKSSWMMDPTRSREMPSCSAIDSAEIRPSSKIS